MLKNLTTTLCKDLTGYIQGNLVYIVRLACSLTKREHNCLCVPKQEHIPIITDETVAKYNQYSSCDKLTDEIKQLNNKVEEKPSLRQKMTKASTSHLIEDVF